VTGIRHFTASAIVLNDNDQVLLVRHNKIRQWLYPGGHIDPDEDPAQAALREVAEETGILADVLTDPLFMHPSVTVHPPPWAILEMRVSDSEVGTHHHIDLVYVLRHRGGQLSAQLAEVSGARWVPIGEVARLDTPPELPSLVSEAATWAKVRWPANPQPSG